MEKIRRELKDHVKRYIIATNGAYDREGMQNYINGVLSGMLAENMVVEYSINMSDYHNVRIDITIREENTHGL